MPRGVRLGFLTERLRAAIRSGHLRCNERCIHRPWHFPIHSADCEWNNAVHLIYSRERAEEASLTTEREDPMLSYKNETIDQRFVIIRTHRGGAEAPTNIVLLPGDEAEVDGAVYTVETYFADLSDEDKATLVARDVQNASDTPPPAPTAPTELTDEEKKALAEHVEMERAAAQMQAEGGSATGSGSDGAGLSASTVPSVSTPPVDNDHVAEGAERFGVPDPAATVDGLTGTVPVEQPA